MEEQKFEISPDVYDEACAPEYINAEWLTEQPEMVYRLDKNGQRYYYTLDEQGLPTFYLSVTTFIKQSLPTSPHLIQWMVNNGDNAKDMADEAANYGTFLHIQCGRLLEHAKYDLDLLPYHLEQYIEKEHLPYSFKKHASGLRKDILSFAQFMIEFNVVPIAIEIILTDKERRVAGALDIVCEMDYEVECLTEEVFKSGPRKGQRKPGKEKIRIPAIVDIKSGRKGFYDSHAIQLEQYRIMWNKHFPEIPIKHTFNWSPKDWRNLVPTYNLKEQSNNKAIKKLDHIVAIAQIEDMSSDKSLTICHGEIDIHQGLHNNIEITQLSEMVKRRHEPIIMDDSESDAENRA